MSCEIKFSEEEFLSHSFEIDETIEVNAKMLQKYVIENREIDAELKHREIAIDILSSVVKSLSDEIKSLKFQREPKYSLDLTA